MTLDIKAIARQSGGDYDTDESDPMSLVMFYQNELAEFVRLVRESALDEAADIVANIVRYTRVEAHDAIRSLK